MSGIVVPSGDNLCKKKTGGSHGEVKKKKERSGSAWILWTEVEVERLGHALEIFGRDWDRITEFVGTKAKDQCQNKVKKEVLKGRMQRPVGSTPWNTRSRQVRRISSTSSSTSIMSTTSSLSSTSTSPSCSEVGLCTTPSASLLKPGPADCALPTVIKARASSVESCGAFPSSASDNGTFHSSTSSLSSDSSGASVSKKAAAFGGNDGGALTKVKTTETTGSESTNSMWSDDEIAKLGNALEMFGRDWSKVTKFVGTKTNQQCQNKVKKELHLGRIMRRQGNTGLVWTKDGVKTFDLAAQKAGPKAGSQKRKRSVSAEKDARGPSKKANNGADKSDAHISAGAANSRRKSLKEDSESLVVMVGAKERLAAWALLSLKGFGIGTTISPTYKSPDTTDAVKNIYVEQKIQIQGC